MLTELLSNPSAVITAVCGGLALLSKEGRAWVKLMDDRRRRN